MDILLLKLWGTYAVLSWSCCVLIDDSPIRFYGKYLKYRGKGIYLAVPWILTSPMVIVYCIWRFF